MKELRILAMDPGTRKFAASVVVVRYHNEKLSFKIEGTCMLNEKFILRDMKIMRKSLCGFLEYMNPLLSQSFDAIVAERFQSRGGKGPTIESVNCMLGGMASVTQHVPVMDFYTAGTWKNAFNLFGDLKEMYEDHKVLRRDKSLTHIEIHQLDACLLGLYQASKMLGLKPFNFVGTRAKETLLLEKLDGAPKLVW